MRPRWLLTTLLLSIFAGTGAAAEWTKIDANTTANLWGVCYGDGQYVAVGTGGTILTSPDGTKWTARVSGTPEWLTAVAYGNNLYVAVGDHGVILTSPDAVTWTARANSGPRLNGIAFGGGRFLTVGEAGTVRASTDTITWSTRTLPVKTWLRGVCYGPDGFLIGGGDGTTASTNDGHVFRFAGATSFCSSIEAIFYSERAYWKVGAATIAWTDLRTHFSADGLPESFSGDFGSSPLRGIARSNNTMVAVGASGTVVTSSLRPYRSDEAAFTTKQLGSAQLNAMTTGPSGAVIVGENGSIYYEAALSSQVVPPNSAEITSLPDTLFAGGTIHLFATAAGSRPFTYQWLRNGQPVAGATEDYFRIRNAGLDDTGSYSVMIRNAAGAATARFDLPALSGNLRGEVDHAFEAGTIEPITGFSTIPIRGGSFLVSGVSENSGQICYRLHSDGSWDLGFRAEIPLRWMCALPDGGTLVFRFRDIGLELIRLKDDGSADPDFRPIAEGYPIVLADGKIISVSVLNTNVAGRPIIAAFRRFNADGSPDMLYSNFQLELAAAERNGRFDTPGFRLADYASDSAGRILVAISSAQTIGTGAFGSNESRILRLESNGEPDMTFRLKETDFPIDRLAAVGDKIYCRAPSQSGPLGSLFSVTFVRYNADGSPDESYRPILVQWGPSYLEKIPSALLSDGSVLAIRRNVDSIHHPFLQRYQPDGLLVNEVPLEVYGLVSEILPLDNGQVLLSGSFSSVNGVSTSGLARLAMATPTHDPATYLSNLSIRTTAGSGDQTLIAGFVIAGEGGSRPLLARGVGPGLVPLGIDARNVTADPQLKLFRGSSVIEANDDWEASLESTANALGAYPLSRNSKDAALFTSLPPGPYTLHVTGATTTPGIALVELYDADHAPATASSPRLVNLAGRARVGAGDDVLIAGFVLSGEKAKRLLIRAVGPGLRALGVNDVLADPQLTIHRGAEAIATNDDWSSSDQPVFTQVGAFDLTTGSKDAALVADLVPGVYTAVVRGVNNTTGTALVEVYEVP